MLKRVLVDAPATPPPRRTGHGASGSSGAPAGPRRPRRRPSMGFDSAEPVWREPDREQHVDAHLQELRLPVLERRLAEVGRGEVLAERHRRLAVGELLLVVRPETGQRLAAEPDREERRRARRRRARCFEGTSASRQTYPSWASITSRGHRFLTPPGIGSERPVRGGARAHRSTRRGAHRPRPR